VQAHVKDMPGPALDLSEAHLSLEGFQRDLFPILSQYYIGCRKIKPYLEDLVRSLTATVDEVLVACEARAGPEGLLAVWTGEVGPPAPADSGPVLMDGLAAMLAVAACWESYPWVARSLRQRLGGEGGLGEFVVGIDLVALGLVFLRPNPVLGGLEQDWRLAAWVGVL